MDEPAGWENLLDLSGKMPELHPARKAK